MDVRLKQNEGFEGWERSAGKGEKGNLMRVL